MKKGYRKGDIDVRGWEGVAENARREAQVQLRAIAASCDYSFESCVRARRNWKVRRNAGTRQYQ